MNPLEATEEYAIAAFLADCAARDMGWEPLCWEVGIGQDVDRDEVRMLVYQMARESGLDIDTALAINLPILVAPESAIVGATSDPMSKSGFSLGRLMFYISHEDLDDDDPAD